MHLEFTSSDMSALNQLLKAGGKKVSVVLEFDDVLAITGKLSLLGMGVTRTMRVKANQGIITIIEGGDEALVQIVLKHLIDEGILTHLQSDVYKFGTFSAGDGLTLQGRVHLEDGILSFDLNAV